MAVPLRHFVVGTGFLLVGSAFGLGLTVGVAPGSVRLAHVHLLLVGWVCVTIMGAMTQFVPVWSGVALHSRRLAGAQLALVVVGLTGFALALVLSRLGWTIAFGALLVAGFWVFVYNLARTLSRVDRFDVTERHFALALGFFLAATALGFLLAVDFTRPLLARTPVARTNLLATHATLAVFGAVLTTVYGALYQLATMFTQTELGRGDRVLRRVEEACHPVGVAFLAVGRFADWQGGARLGGVLVLVAAVSVSAILARRLIEMRVDWTPMHVRYAVAAPALASWALLAVPAWIRDPTASATLFGAPGTGHLLLLGAVGFVVFGTLYHVVPFVVWVHRYSDLLGYEPVPLIDDLYDRRLAAVDGALLTSGTALLAVAGSVPVSGNLGAIAGGLVGLGVVAFATNLVSVVRAHSPQSLDEVVLGPLTPRRRAPGERESAGADR